MKALPYIVFDLNKQKRKSQLAVLFPSQRVRKARTRFTYEEYINICGKKEFVDLLQTIPKYLRY
ncbi:MAG: hypothetical protein A2173_10370 [Planctomycetes bacterium RBG_13_44_8b]|nr:MAG: hypothetical protein A2173_10370 [Planctomycetes bacterium RBG_13_44_8b]